MASWEGAARRCDRPGGRRGLREVSEGAGRPVESPPPGVSGRGPLGPPSRTPTRARRPGGRPPLLAPFCSHTRAPGRARGGGGPKPPPRTLPESLNGKRSPPSLAPELRGRSSRSVCASAKKGEARPLRGGGARSRASRLARGRCRPLGFTCCPRGLAAMSERRCSPCLKTSCWIERDRVLFPDSSGRVGREKVACVREEKERAVCEGLAFCDFILFCSWMF